jgi:hypothetical protein
MGRWIHEVSTSLQGGRVFVRMAPSAHKLLDLDFTEHGDGAVTVAMTNRGVRVTLLRQSQHESWKRSLDKQAQLVPR